MCRGGVEEKRLGVRWGRRAGGGGYRPQMDVPNQPRFCISKITITADSNNNNGEKKSCFQPTHCVSMVPSAQSEPGESEAAARRFSHFFVLICLCVSLSLFLVGCDDDNNWPGRPFHVAGRCCQSISRKPSRERTNRTPPELETRDEAQQCQPRRVAASTPFGCPSSGGSCANQISDEPIGCST